MLISSWLTSVRNRLQYRVRVPKRRAKESRRSVQMEEVLETRALLAAPTLVTVRPNVGAFIQDGDTRNIAPRELTLQFNPGQTIDNSNNRLFVNSPVIVERSGHDGLFDNGNEVPVTLGYVGLGATPEDVVIRFAENLPDDYYRITIKGTGANPLRNTSGEALGNGTDKEFHLRLDLAAQVKAVVPQPITRLPNGTLQQARNQIVVYFNEDTLQSTSAQTPAFYRLMNTRNTVENTDDSVHLPASVAYNTTAKTATLTFSSDIDVLAGAGTYRLRIGTDETLPIAPSRTTYVETFRSDFGTGTGTVTIDPITSVDGNPISLTFQSADLNSNGVPQVSVSGRNITVTLDGPGGSTTNATQLFWAINLHPQASQLVRVALDGDILANVGATTLTPFTTVLSDPGSAVRTTTDLGTLGSQAQVISGQIRTVEYPFDFPGNSDEPGHRNIDVTHEAHLDGSPDTNPQISTFYYNFQPYYGYSQQGVALANLITENQKQRAREIFSLYSNYMGVQFIESASLGFTVVTGDMRAIDPSLPTGAGYLLAQSSRALNLAILDNAESWDDSYGGSWFRTAMHEIGFLLGFGQATELPDLTIMSGHQEGATGNPSIPVSTAEPDFPGDGDIVHGRVLYRPESKDIDLYRFELPETGLFTAETIAERLSDSSLLDTALRLYRQKQDGTLELVSQNDDYFSEDSLIQLTLSAGVYFVGVSASGNDQYNPAIADSGINGTTQGAYDLRIAFRPSADNAIVDNSGIPLDGDLDGVAGGEFNFWFRAVPASAQLIVDRTAPDGGTGTLSAPFNKIDLALAAAGAGTVVRVVGNAGADNNINTVADNVAYQVGLDDSGNVLRDGANLEIPRDVVVMIDAGTVLKFNNSYVSAGSSSLTVDRSGGSLQVLGTPQTSVTMTSWKNESVGQDTTATPTTPQQGNWGGLIFQRDVDNDESRINYERAGIFMDYVSHADMSYGGGKLIVESIQQIVNPVTLIEARPGIYNNFITLSEDSAISADPDSFEESTFNSPAFQGVPFTADYGRVGPDIYGNRLINNSTNGLFVRIQTAPGAPTKKMTVTGRFDDTDIVHVVAQNLEVQGTPGGPFLEVAAPPVPLVKLTAQSGGTLTAGTYNYKIVYRDSSGNQSPASAATRSLTVGGANGRILLENLPPATAPFNSRLIYRSEADGTGPYQLVAILNASVTSYTDNGSALTGFLNESLIGRNRARLDASLVIDPEMIIKLEGARIEAGMGAQIIAEGEAGREIIFTSRLDDRYGVGGTFDTNNDDNLGNGESRGAAGNWGGIYLGSISSGSFDRVLMTFGGGMTPISGSFRNFNVIEAHQADLRLTNSVLENNANGVGSGTQDSRFGKTANASATIFVRGAQPVILNNVIRDNLGSVININANALTADFVQDSGRSRGAISLFGQYGFNQGPLIDGNLLGRNDINGMVIRGETLTTQSVWDDTDIVHVLRSEIIVPNFHTYGGLRLNSDPDASLVVKLDSGAGLTAGGKPLDIVDRIGGTLQIVGQPFFPVILTSLRDDSVGAGFDLSGLPLKDTTPNISTGASRGDWRSIRIGEFANDRNVEVYNEREVTSATAPGTNSTAAKAEFLGELGTQDLRRTNADGTHEIDNTSDATLRLGFEVHGYINSPNDIDVYSFTGEAGAEVWIDVDRTTHGFDPVVELISAAGVILVQSDNSLDEINGEYAVFKAGQTNAQVLDKSIYLSDDMYTTNQRDAGFRVILPGVTGSRGTYQVRVRSSNIDSENPAANRGDLQNSSKLQNGLTSGNYQMQIRLQELDEVPGSTVRYADIRFATNGIEILGQPAHSPLVGEYSENTADSNNSAGGAEIVGNILNTDRAAVAIAGRITAPTDVDFYRFNVTYDDIQQINGNPALNINPYTPTPRYVSVVFDVDYADGMSRANLQAHIFDAVTGQLILTARDSNISDDRSGPLEGADMDDLSRGSVGALDPYIGPFELPEGSYYLVVAPHEVIPAALNQTMVANPFSNTIRLEPITSIRRIADEHFGGFGTAEAPLYDLFDNEQGQNLTTFHLGDVNMFVNVSGGGFTDVYMVDPFTGVAETYLGGFGRSTGDAAMRADGELFAYGWTGATDGSASRYLQIDTGTAAITDLGDDGILTFHPDNNTPPAAVNSDVGIQVTAMTYFSPTTTGGLFVGQRGDGTRGGIFEQNILYQFNARTGAAISQGPLRTGNNRDNPPSGTDVIEVLALGGNSLITGLASDGAQFFAVNEAGQLLEITAFGAVFVNTILDANGDPVVFQGLSFGPDEVEGGAFASTLFGIDENGVMYAFDTNGDLQPIFVDGQSSINTGLAGAVGLSFGTLDYNLWSTTGNRGTDVGHGLPATPDGTRLDTPGGASLYFGNLRGGPTAGNKNDLGNEGTVNDLNFPGGAHGSFITNAFSLEGYSKQDKPALYFNYFMETDSRDYIPGVRPITDALRVYVGDGTTWNLVATNDSYRAPGAINDEQDFGPFGTATQHPTTQLFLDVVELYDENAAQGWRQARIDLSNMAGLSDLRLRFEFSTAGSMNVGDISTVGEEFYARSGSKLRDGQSYIFEGVNQHELDMGYTLVAVGGSRIADGETFTIQGVTFEFNKSGSVTGGNIPVVITDAMSAETVAEVMETAIDAAAIADVKTYRDSNRVNFMLEQPLLPISTAVTVTQSFGASVIREGSPGITAGTTAVVIHSGMTSTQVAEAMSQSFADHHLPAGTYRETEFNNAPDPLLAMDLEALSWTNAVNNTVTDSATIPHISVISTSDAFTGTDYFFFTVPNNGTRVIADLDGTSATFNSGMRIVDINGVVLFENLDSGTADVASNHGFDPFLDVVLDAGDYFIQVGVPRAYGGASPGERYTLHLSVEGHAVEANGPTNPLVVDRSVIKGNADLVRIIGHYVSTAGPMGLTTYLPGDEFGGFFASQPSLRGTVNEVEGVYIDDIVIGLVERGEMVTNAPNGLTTFIANPEVNDPNNLNPYNDILTGEYDVEIRRASDYAAGSGSPNPQFTSFNSNDRLTEQQTMIVPNATQLHDGQTFTLSDGVNSVVFEYDDVNSGDGVTSGRVQILFDPAAPGVAGDFTGETASVIAARIRDAINSPAVQGILNVRASLSDGASTSLDVSADSRVNVYGNAKFTFADGLQNETPDDQPVGIDGRIRAVGNSLGSTSLFHFTNTSSLFDNQTGLPELITRIVIQLPAGQTFDRNPLDGGNGSGPDINPASSRITPTFGFNDTLDVLTVTFPTTGAGTFFSGEQLIFGVDVDNLREAIPNLGSIINVTFSTGRTVKAVFVEDRSAGLIGKLREVSDANSIFTNGGYGDQNVDRQQGQLIIHSNFVSDSAQWGIFVDAGARTGGSNPPLAGILPHPGSVRNLREINTSRLVPGVVISNNVVTSNLTGGILFSGDAAGGVLGAVPVGLIMNNTVVGNLTSAGIRVEQNASPTLLNNIIADTATAIFVDPSSEALGTVVGNTLYRGNGVNASTGSIGLGTFPIVVLPLDPDFQLFVDQANRNYYPIPLSRAIDSSLDSLDDRAAMITVRDPLGIGLSTIKAPSLDVYGQVRGDDPAVATPSAQGANVFKDRGAIDRVDFFQPTARLTGPLDQAANDLEPTLNSVRLNDGETLRQFVVTLSDAGIGIDDARVNVSGNQFKLYQDIGSGFVQLAAGVDYQFVYNSTTNEVIFRATTEFPLEASYRIEVDNSPATVDGVNGIVDLAGNYLAANEIDGTTKFHIFVTDGENDPPVNIVPPGTQTVPEDGLLFFTSANSNRIGVSDPDARLGTNRLRVTLSVTNGLLRLSTTTGLVFTTGDGTDDAVMTFEGAIPDLNTALSNLRFAPAADYFGPAVLTITTDDLGQFNGPSSPAESDTDTVNIDVLPVNDRPTFTLAGDPVAVNEDSGAQTVVNFMTGQVPGPANESSQTLTTEVSVVSVTGAWSAATFFAAGGLPAIDPVTGTLTYRAADHVNGTALVEVIVRDSLGLPSLNPQTFTITVTAINDEPVFTPNSAVLPLVFNEDAGLTSVNLISSFSEGPAGALDEPPLQKPTWILSSPVRTSGNVVFSTFEILDDGTFRFETLADTAGTATFTLRLEDDGSNAPPNDNTSATVNFTITITQVNDAPVAVTGPYVIDEGDSLLLNASASFDVDEFFGDILTYEWDLNGDGTFETSSGTSDTLTRTWAQLTAAGIVAPSVYNTRLRVTDSALVSHTVTTTLTTLIVDYGDAPNSYGTRKTSNGAAHTITGPLYLGATVDKELSGTPTAGATGDGADEDGVTFPSTLEVSPTLNLPSFVNVVSSATGKLDAWIDLNNDGVFNHPGEHLGGGTSINVVAGLNRVDFVLPAGTTTGNRLMRFRVSTAGGLAPTGRASNGEVEDYVVNVIPLQTAVKPTVLKPIDFNVADGLMAVTSDLTPLVEWSFHSANYFHNIEVKNAGNVTVFSKSGETTTTVNVTPQLLPGVYTVSVVGVNRALQPSAAATYTFEVLPISVTSPTGVLLTHRPTVTWNEIRGSKSYTIEIESVVSGQPVHTGTVVVASVAPPNTPTSYEVPVDLPLGQYRVRVRATDAADLAGDWSAYSAFQVRASTTITAPVSGPNLRPTVVWNAVPGALTYDIQIDDVTDNVRPLYRASGLTGTSWTPPADLRLGEYVVWVRAFNGTGDSSVWSNGRTFLVTPKPTIITPNANERLPDSTPTFGWNAIADADRYELIVRRDFGDRAIVINQSGIRTTSFTQPANLPLGPYKYTVRAINDPANAVAFTPVFSLYSDEISFSITTPPTITAPQSTTFSHFPLIQWSNPLGSEKSDVWVEQEGVGGELYYVLAEGVSGTQYTPTRQFGIGTYKVRVRTYSNTDDPATVGVDERVPTEWSVPKTFRVATPPVILGPVGRVADATPTLTWQSVPGGQTYEVAVNSTSIPAADVVRVAGLNSLSYTVPNDLPIGRYKFWVRAKNAFGVFSNWSAVTDFEIVAAPVLSGPPSSTFVTTPSFTWNSLAMVVKSKPAGASSYEFRLDDVTNQVADKVRVAGLTATNYTVGTALSQGLYRAYVRAFTPGASAADPTDDTLTDWSLPVEFFVGGRPVVNAIGTITSQTPTITWQPVQGASGYEIFIAAAATPNVPVINVSGIGATAYTVSTPLAKGDYRVWVRAINATTGGLSPWSISVNMKIVDSDAQTPEDAADQAVLVAVTGASEFEALTTTTTIGMIQSLLPVTESVKTDSTAADAPVAESQAPVIAENVSEKDSVLSVWDEQLWWDEPVDAVVAEEIVPPAVPSASEQPVERNTESKTDSAGVGMLAALMALTPRALRRRRRQK